MGHYAAEMSCSECGKLRCTCAIVPNQDTKKWIVEIENNYQVIQVDAYDKKYATLPGKYGPIDGMPFLRRCKRKHFDIKSEAQTHAKQLLDELISEREEKLKELKEIRSVME
jgi:hypothetical protein